MEADMSLISLVSRASTLVQLVMLALLAASLLSWVVIFTKHKVLKLAREDAVRIERRGMARIFESGFAEYARLHKRTTGSGEMLIAGVQRSMKVSLAREEDRLESNLSLLATIGSISPYVGLFGTVWGIMRSFTALGSVQNATLAMVAPGIAEALIATAMGLFAAIPAVIAYNRYSDQVDRLIGSYENFAEEFSTILQRQSIAELEERPAEVA